MQLDAVALDTAPLDMCPDDTSSSGTVSNDITLTWNLISNAVGNQIATGWDTLLVAGDESDLYWSVANTVGATQAIGWNTTTVNPVGTQYDINWGSDNTVSVALDIFYNDYTIVTGPQFASSWNTALLAQANFTLGWSAGQTIGAQLSLNWNIARLAGSQFTANWKMIQSAGADLALEWGIFLKATASVSMSWYTLEQTQFTPLDQSLLDVANANIADLIARRGPGGGGSNPYRTVELYGGTILEPLPYEPDPNTHRDEYYINGRDSRVYRRVYDRRQPERGIIVAHWVGISG